MNKPLFIRSNGKFEKLDLDQVIYVAALGDYVNIYLRDKRFTVHEPLVRMELMLPQDRFLRVHRSFIINIEKLESITGALSTGGEACVGGMTVPLGPGFAKSIRSRIEVMGNTGTLIQEQR